MHGRATAEAFVSHMARTSLPVFSKFFKKLLTKLELIAKYPAWGVMLLLLCSSLFPGFSQALAGTLFVCVL